MSSDSRQLNARTIDSASPATSKCTVEPASIPDRYWTSTAALARGLRSMRGFRFGVGVGLRLRWATSAWATGSRGGSPQRPPTRSTLTCHRRRVAAVSYEDLLDCLGLPSTKYWPVSPATCGDAAREIDVAAPWAVVFKNGRISGLKMVKNGAWSSAPNDVRATAGCRTLTVTPLPCRRVASS